MPLEKLTEKVRGKKDAVSGESTEDAKPGTTDEMPVVPHKALYVDLPIYTDPEGRNQTDGRIAVLRPLDPDGYSLLDVVPTRKEYKAGQYLTWQLNKDKLWEECYYRNPETGQIEQAWTMHVEFVGKVVSDQAVDLDQARLQKLEELYSSKTGPLN